MNSRILFGVLVVLLVLLFACETQKQEGIGGVSRDDSFQGEDEDTSDFEEEEGGGAEIDTSAAIEARTKINFVKTKLNKISDGADVDLAENLISIAEKNYDSQKYERALDLAQQADSLIRNIKVGAEERAGGAAQPAQKVQITKIELRFDHGTATARVFSGINEINILVFQSLNKIDATREIAARLGVSESFVSSVLVVVDSSENIDSLSDMDGYNECLDMFNDFDRDDDPGDIDDNDVEDCENFFDDAEDEFGRDELKDIDGFSECKDIFSDFNKDDDTDDISPSDVRDCEDFFDELKDEFDKGEI